MTPEQTQALTAIAEARNALQAVNTAEALILLDSAAQSIWAIQTVGYSQAELDSALANRLTPAAQRLVNSYFALVQRGYGLAEIGAKFGKTAPAVHSALRRAGLPTCAAKARATAPRLDALPAAKPSAKKFDRLQAYAMLREGDKLEMIAEHFNVTRAAVSQGLQRAKLPTSNKAYRMALEAGTLERDYPGTTIQGE